jgi:hypothetical protein
MHSLVQRTGTQAAPYGSAGATCSHPTEPYGLASATDWESPTQHFAADVYKSSTTGAEGTQFSLGRALPAHVTRWCKYRDPAGSYGIAETTYWGLKSPS